MTEHDDQRSPSPERLDELLALAALGELTPADERALDFAAANDPTVASELEDMLATAAALQDDPHESAPEGLRSSVLDAIAGEPQEAPPTEPSPPIEQPIGQPKSASDVVDLGARRRRRFGAVLAAAAAALVVIGGAVLVVSPGGADEIAAVVDADDATARRLEGTLTGTLDVVHSSAEDAIVVEGSGLDPLASDETLQLWLIVDDRAESVGVFRPDADGEVRVRFDGVDPSGVVLGVTVEPGSGSSTPTLPVVASA